MGIKAIKFRMEQYLKGCNDMMEKVCVTCQQAREDDKDSSSFKVKRWQFGYPGQGMVRSCEDRSDELAVLGLTS